MAKTKKGSEPKQQIEKIQNGLYSVEKGGIIILASNNGTAYRDWETDRKSVV